MKENFKYMINNWIKWDKKSLIYFIIRVPALVFQPIVTAYIPKAMIDCIEQGATIERLVMVIALLSLLLTFTIWMDPFMSELIRGGARIVRMRYAVMAFNKNLNTSYANIENLEKREIQKRAEDFYNARYSGGANFIDKLNQFCVCVLGVITSSVLIYKINVIMILLIIATCAGEFFILRAINMKTKENHDDLSKFRTKFSYFYKVSKDTDAAKDVQLYGFSDYFVKALADTLYQIEKTVAKFTHQSVSFNAYRALLNLVREAVAYAYLIYLVTKGQLTISDFIFYFGIITGFSNWVMNLVSSYINIEMDCKECQAYRDYIEDDSDADFGEDIKIHSIDSIELKNVSFKYPLAESNTIKNISLTFNKGENIAIVGENGSGKTTLIKLICGLYKITDGEILINGINADRFSRNSYYDLFSAIFQDYYFLPMTIAQNISAELNPDMNKLLSAFEKAGILEKINSLTDKENSMMDKGVYNNAVDFSGGEKQKLLLAKAVYKNAPVLILDEPTAALDPVAENEIYSRFNSFVENKTAIYISHRLSSCVFCSRIAVFDSARLVESGTHQDLLANNGKYAELWNAQAQYYV